jgi:hypothetical protein
MDGILGFIAGHAIDCETGAAIVAPAQVEQFKLAANSYIQSNMSSV